MPELDLHNLWPMIVSGGFIVGLLVGMTGVGAGSLMTPFLISQIGVAPTLAVGTDLLFASITKASASLPHHSFGNVNWRLVAWLAAGSVPGSLATLAVLKVFNLDPSVMAYVIKHALIAALFLSSLAIIIYPAIARAHRASTATGDDGADIPIRKPATVLLGLVLGSIVTLTSVGAGAIGVVILTLLYPMMRTRRLIGTDVVHAVPLTLVSGLGHLSMGNVNFSLLAILLAGSVPGIVIGSRLTGLLPDWLLRVALAAILCFAAYQLYLKL